MTDTNWIKWAREIQALAQTATTYAENHFQTARYQRLTEIAAEMMAAPAGMPSHAVLRILETQTGYATPKVDVRGACFRDNKILMVQEKSDGLWSLPGGWADVNQSASECAAREVFEETGFEVQVKKLAAVFDREKHPHQPSFAFHIYKMCFMCEITGGSIQASDETFGADFFAEDALPPLSIDRIVEGQIKVLFAHHRDPARPADFD